MVREVATFVRAARDCGNRLLATPHRPNQNPVSDWSNACPHTVAFANLQLPERGRPRMPKLPSGLPSISTQKPWSHHFWTIVPRQQHSASTKRSIDSGLPWRIPRSREASRQHLPPTTSVIFATVIWRMSLRAIFGATPATASANATLLR